MENKIVWQQPRYFGRKGIQKTIKHAIKFSFLTIFSRPLFKRTLLILTSILAIAPFSAFSQNDISKNIRKTDNLTVYSANAKPKFDIRLKKITSYGDTKNLLLGPRIVDVEVDERGRVYLLDFSRQKIHVFNPDGTFLQDVGRRGKGPGEFSRAVAIKVSNHSLYILDKRQKKISIFTQDTFKHRRDLNISLENADPEPSWFQKTRGKKFFYRANDFIVKSNGALIIIFSDDTVGPGSKLSGRTYEFSLFDPEKETYIKHNLWSFRWSGGVLVNKKGGGVEIIYHVPYKRTSQFCYGNGQLVYGWTENFLFKFYDENGSYQHAFYYPFKKAKLKQKDVLNFYKKSGLMVKQAIRNDDLPDTWPAFNSLTLDDKNRLWVSVINGNPTRKKWFVFNKAGRLLATFQWPQNYKLQQVKNNYAYTLQRNKRTGFQSIVKYKISMK